ncbi:hypothetical protein REPUB_Repub11eG0105400 [Reevesia pubescens]
MSSSNFIRFPVQENAYIQERFIQQRQRRQALGMTMTTLTETEYPFAYQNPYNYMLSPPPQFYGSLNRNRLLGVIRSNSMIHKLHQVRAWMCMARRFGIGGGAHRARARASFLRNRNLLVITRQIPVINHQVADVAFTCFQDKSTSRLIEGSDSTVEVHGLDEDEKLQEFEEQEDGLDLRLKL